MLLHTIWPYVLLLFFVAFEGEFAIIAASGAASAGLLNLPAVFIVAVMGNTVSDLGWYALGYFGRIDWLVSKVRWTGLTPEKLDLMTGKIRQNTIRMLTLTKLTNAMTIPALVATGVARVSWRRWLWLVLLSNFIIAVIFVSLGYTMTHSFLQIRQGLRTISTGVTLLLILLVGLYVRRLLGQKKQRREGME